MQRAVRIAAVSSGVALAAQLHSQSTFLGKEVSSFDGPEHDGAWYRAQCDKINDECEERKERLRRKYEEDLAELKAEWKKNEDILAEKKSKHADEKADVKPQQKAVDAERKDVKEARVAVKEKAHCPPDLETAKARLATLEAVPNKTPKEVDEECELRKKILKLEACVKELRAAEAVLSKEKDQHEEENADLRDETAEESEAASAVPPQERETADSKAAYEAFKARGVRGIDEINEECQSDRDALERKADADVRTVEDEYLRQKREFGARVDTHEDEKADVVDQKKEVIQEQKDVEEARKSVAEHDHCPAELDSKEARLSVLESKPNKSPQDVDEECEIKKKILELKACVQKLRAAEEVLAKENHQYGEEHADLKDEKAEAMSAGRKVPPQKNKVSDLEGMLADAKAAREAICSAPNEKKSAPAPASSDDKKAPEPKSGAERSTITLAVVAVLLSSFLRA